MDPQCRTQNETQKAASLLSFPKNTSYVGSSNNSSGRHMRRDIGTREHRRHGIVREQVGEQLKLITGREVEQREYQEETATETHYDKRT